MGARVLAILVLVATAAGRKAGSQSMMAYGVIGNTTVSGTVILGSSPGRPAEFQLISDDWQRVLRPVRLAA